MRVPVRLIMLVLVVEECRNESEREKWTEQSAELNGCRARQVIAGRKPETRGGGGKPNADHC